MFLLRRLLQPQPAWPPIGPLSRLPCLGAGSGTAGSGASWPEPPPLGPRGRAPHEGLLSLPHRDACPWHPGRTRRVEPRGRAGGEEGVVCAGPHSSPPVFSFLLPFPPGGSCSAQGSTVSQDRTHTFPKGLRVCGPGAACAHVQCAGGPPPLPAGALASLHPVPPGLGALAGAAHQQRPVLRDPLPLPGASRQASQPRQPPQPRHRGRVLLPQL